MAALLLPALAYADSDRCTSCLVWTPQMIDSVNESICYDDADCLYNLTWVANGTHLLEDQSMTNGAGCISVDSFTLTSYGTDTEDIYTCQGYCHRGVLTGAFDCGTYKSGADIYSEFDMVEENQATAETNQANRTIHTLAYIEEESDAVQANDDANLVTAQADYANGTAEEIANDDRNTATLSSEGLNNTVFTYTEGLVNVASIEANDNANLVIVQADLTNTESNLNYTVEFEVENATQELFDYTDNQTASNYDAIMATNSSIWNKVALVATEVWSDSSLFCKIWGYANFPTSVGVCDSRLVTGTQ